MTARQKLGEALASLSLDNTPTIERQEKSQFSQRDNVWHIRTIAERLYGLERITQDEYNACQRWATTYVLTYDGPGAVQDRASTSEIKHDQISWVMTMAKEKDSIPAIKEKLGDSVHALLVLSLYRCYSAGHIAAILNPDHTRADEKAVERMCISAYRELSKFYELQKFNQKNTRPNVQHGV